MNANNTSLAPQDYYKPSELLNIFKNFLSNKEINATVLKLHGVYFKTDKIYGSACYDKLKDENSAEEITIIVPVSLRDDLNNGNLITVYGTLDRRLNQSGYIQILLNVSRVEKVKDIAISEDEIKRAECRRRKGERGYKNVDSILENLLFMNKRPSVAMLYADTSITNADFVKGLQAAKSNIDFHDFRVSFSNAQLLCTTLGQLDRGAYNVIAIVRGGGSGIEKLDDIRVVEALTNLKTAWIYGVGHENEILFIRNIADKVIPIPFALGTYFRDTVETVIQKRNNSRAVLVQEVKKQYEKQIEDSNKKNQELNKQLEVLQKQSKEQNEAATKQIAALTKSSEENLKQTKEQVIIANKANKDLHEKLDKQGKTLTEFQEQQKKQQEDFSKSLGKMQETNGKLQESLNKLTTQNTQAAKDLSEAKARAKELEQALEEARKKKGCMPGCMGIAAVLIGVIGLACWLSSIFLF
jgi:hypothetical protein